MLSFLSFVINIILSLLLLILLMAPPRYMILMMLAAPPCRATIDADIFFADIDATFLTLIRQMLLMVAAIFSRRHADTPCATYFRAYALITRYAISAAARYARYIC